MPLGVLSLLLIANPYQTLIDRHAKAGSIVDDHRFLRRASLDARGHPPAPDELGRKIGDRGKVIDSWLASDDAAEYWGLLWTDALVQTKKGGVSNPSLFASWVAEQWKHDAPWNEVVTRLLTAAGSREEVPPTSFLLSFGSIEEITGTTARVFLGMSIECAQCHDHPYQDYKVRDFYGLLAFFVRTKASSAVIKDVDFGHARLPSGDVVYPRVPGGISFELRSGQDRRVELAHWMTEQPDFARATVNRIWSLYFGRGLTQNVDDLHDLQPEDAAGTKLLDALADRFRKDGYRVRPLVAGILASRTYQSREPGPLAFQPRPLNPEQLLASLISVTGLWEGGDPAKIEVRRQVLLRMLHATGSEVSSPRTLLLMNSRMLQLGYRATHGTALTEHLESQPNDEARVERLFLAALARKPSADERSLFLAQVRDANPKDQPRVWEDEYWALVNSGEFSSHF